MAKEARSRSTLPDEQQGIQIPENSPAQEFCYWVTQLAKQLGLAVTESNNSEFHPLRLQIAFAPSW